MSATVTPFLAGHTAPTAGECPACRGETGDKGPAGCQYPNPRPIGPVIHHPSQADEFLRWAVGPVRSGQARAPQEVTV